MAKKRNADRTVKVAFTPQEADLLEDLLDRIETISMVAHAFSDVSMPGARNRAEFSSLADKVALAKSKEIYNRRFA